MLIGEVVKKTNLTRDTIRFYEKRGLIKVERSDSEWNNYKNYDDEALQKLLLIRKAKSFGFTLNEIAELLEMFDENTATCEQMTLKVENKLIEIDRKIKELTEMKRMILGKFENVERDCVPNSDLNCQSI